MKADALKTQFEYGEKSGKGTTFHPDAEPKHVYYLNTPDGPKRMEAGRLPHDHKAHDSETIVAKAKERAVVSAETEDTFMPEIWYHRTGVTGVIGMRDRVTLSLSPSPQLKQLVKWEESGRGIVKQAEFILLLRTLFVDCYPDHPTLLEAVRKIDVKKGNDVSAEIRQGKVSMSKSMVAEITGLDKIPETVIFRIPVFAEDAARVERPVRVALDPDPQNEQFVLIPIPGDIERAFAAGEEWLANDLTRLIGADGGVPLFHGKP